MNEAKIGKAVKEFLENPYWKEFYDTAASDTERRYIALNFAWSLTMDEEISNAMSKIESRLGIEDWKHQLKWNGNNPRILKIRRRIAELEAEKKMNKIKKYGLWMKADLKTTVYFELENGLAGKAVFHGEGGGKPEYYLAPHWAFWDKWCPRDFEKAQEGEPPREIRAMAERLVDSVQPVYISCRDEREALEIHARVEKMYGNG